MAKHGKTMRNKAIFRTGFGYGYDPMKVDLDDLMDPGYQYWWYSCSINKLTRQQAQYECQLDLSYLDRNLYTQRWVKIFGFEFRVPFTRRHVPRAVCRYEDCGTGRLQFSDDEPVTCELCRRDLGLPPYKDGCLTDSLPGTNHENYI